MMNFKTKVEAEKTIDQIIALTDEEYLYHLVDEKIDKAVESFSFTCTDDPDVFTHRVFLNIISNFIQHLYKVVPYINQILSETEAKTEAIALLESGYHGAYTRGYYAAFLDAFTANLNGNVLILSSIISIIKETTRQRYVRWVSLKLINPLDFNNQCAIAEILIKRLRPVLPPTLLSCPPAQLANHLPELITAISSTDMKVKKMTGYFF